MRWALAASVVALTVGVASAQTGGITVVVTDDQGNPLPGATVTISHELGYVKTTAELTSKKGTVEFPVLRPGAGYVIEVSFSGGGLSAQRLDEIRVTIGETLTVPVQLMAEFQEEIKVTAQRDLIELEKSETSTKFSDDFIADLPVPGRFYQNVLTMAPGVQDADGDGNPNVHGSRSRDFQAVVSNVSNVDPLTGQWMSRVNPNSIEEMEVITAGAGVEFGRAQGGFARIIQKQGSNTHEGVFEFYYQTSKLDGEGAIDDSALPPAEFETTQPLVQFSGPIVKDKLWYRASLEARDREEPIPVLSGTEIWTTKTQTLDGQVTWQVSPRNKLAFQYRSDPREDENFGLSIFRPPASTYSIDRNVDNYTVSWWAPYSPKVLVESTLAWQEVNIGTNPTLSGQSNSCVFNAQEFLTAAECIDLNNFTASGSYFQSTDDMRQRFTARGQATVYGGRFWGMSHEFQMGLTIENERYFRNLVRNPRMFYTVVNTINDDPDCVDCEGKLEAFGLGFLRLSAPSTDDVRATGTNWGFYVEDQFKPKQNLNLTLGLRLDREEISSEGRSIFDPSQELGDYLATVEAKRELTGEGDKGEIFPKAFTGYEDFETFQAELTKLVCTGSPEPGSCAIQVAESIKAGQAAELNTVRSKENIGLENWNFSPFFSVAWLPGNSGKTALRAAVGRHYNNIPLLIPLQELEPAVTDLEYRISLQEGGGARPNDLVSPAVNVLAVDRDLSTPYQDEFTFSVERELWAETSVTVTFIDRRFRDQIQDVNTNLEVGDYGRCQAQQLTPTGPTPPVIPSPGSGQAIKDLYSGATYIDSDPGDGDGREDDCVGRRTTVSADPTEPDCDPSDPFCSNLSFIQQPDGLTDLYIQNPFWGDIFLIGNFNEIDYQAVVVELIRRQYRSWEMNASYTYSEAEGDGEDFFQELGDDPSLRAATQGYQSYDQRHVVKLNATTITPWGVRLGTSVSWQSGLPYSLLYQYTSIDTYPPEILASGLAPGASGRTRQVYPTNVRNDQRNIAYWNVDLKATKEFTLGRGLNMQLSAEIFNALNDGTYQVYNPFFERGIQVNGVNEATNRFGRRWQLGMKLAW
jgi:hypothetical protein